MANDWIRVRDTRTNEILPHTVPRAHLDIYDHLKEVPSSRKRADRVTVTEPVQPAAGVPVTEPHTPAKRGQATPATTIQEPAKPEKTKEA
ncbi:hypothetical protein [Arthrobacter sp. G119Y2]|uniref:hypothetical protein n=1 Tax=Arthrobacter sp. G119Y2 TaxID=3134965 RepID=UPI003119EFD5